MLDFYKAALVGLQPGPDFQRYMSPDFVDQKPDVEGGTRETVSAYLQGLIKSLPQPRWEILRTVAEGDLVFLHARFRSDFQPLLDHIEGKAGAPLDGGTTDALIFLQC